MNELSKSISRSPQYSLNGGRVELSSNGTELTLRRGIHLVIKAGIKSGYSTEGTSVVNPSGENGGISITNLDWLPIALHTSVSEAGVGLRVTMNLEVFEPIQIKEILVRCPLSSDYDMYFVSGERHMILKDHCGTLWSGIPRGGYAGFASSNLHLPPVRITLDLSAPVFEMHLGKRMDDDFSYPFIDIVRTTCSQTDELIKPGKYTVAEFTVDHHDEYLPMMKYPKELFSQNPFRTGIVVSSLDNNLTMYLSTFIQDRLPYIWSEETMVPVKIEKIELPKNMSELIELARRVRLRKQETLVIRLQHNINDGFGWLFNTFALLTQAPYKLKLDPAGNSMFFSNNLNELTRNRWRALKHVPNRLILRMLKAMLALGWVILFPVLYFQERKAGR